MKLTIDPRGNILKGGRSVRNPDGSPGEAYNECSSTELLDAQTLWCKWANTAAPILPHAAKWVTTRSIAIPANGYEYYFLLFTDGDLMPIRRMTPEEQLLVRDVAAVMETWLARRRTP